MLKVVHPRLYSDQHKKHVFVDLKAKAEGIIPIEQFRSSKELENLNVTGN